SSKKTADENIELSFIETVKSIGDGTVKGISDRTVRGISNRTVRKISDRTVRGISGRTVEKTCTGIEVIRRDIVEVELIFSVILSKTSNFEPISGIRECIISLEISISEIKKKSSGKTSKAIEYN
ncbi:16095_t:CDS:1, partial [Funneliformis caledonium]